MNDTVFCTREFVDAWCHHFEGKLRPVPIALDSANRRPPVFAVATVGRTGLWAVDFAPSGFFASPGWNGELSSETIECMLAQLQSNQVRRFEWNVRYDHQPLAEKLASRLPSASRVTTQVLVLRANYEESFRQFNATIRNQVRKARSRGVVVEASTSALELSEYYAIHRRLADSKGGYGFMFPESFLLALIETVAGCRFLVARNDDQIIGGGLFLRDGDTVFYLHGAHDHQFSKQFPMCAVLDEAVQWAHRTNARAFNFGGSAGIESLEKFKSFWGAETVCSWRFGWRNPLWTKLDGARNWIRKLTHSS